MAHVEKLGLPGLKKIKLSNYERQRVGLAILLSAFFQGPEQK